MARFSFRKEPGHPIKILAALSARAVRNGTGQINAGNPTLRSAGPDAVGNPEHPHGNAGDLEVLIEVQGKRSNSRAEGAAQSHDVNSFTVVSACLINKNLL